MNTLRTSLVAGMLVLLSACEVNVNNSGDINADGTKSTKSTQNQGFGACGSWAIVGQYEGGLEITASCNINYGEEALVIGDVDAGLIEDVDFKNIQDFFADDTQSLETTYCKAQLFNDELFLDCDGFSYRGKKQ